MSGGTIIGSEYLAAKTSVWWDIEDCVVPKDCDGKSVAENIKSALFKLGYNGPVSISAYGDTSKIPEYVQRGLSSTGVSLNHVPPGLYSTPFYLELQFNSGGDDTNINELLVHMMRWVVDNPAPANILLISGKKSALSDAALHYLGERRYNILLSTSLPAAAFAKTVWNWTSLLTGRSPIGGGGEKEEALAEYKNVETSVWWNVEDCKVPPHWNLNSTLRNLTKNIKSALFDLGYQGPVSCVAYASADSPQYLLRAFINAGIRLWHFAPGKIEEGMVADMLDWIMENAAPANIMLLSGHEIFCKPLTFLGGLNYNILLSASLPAAAKIVWHWDTLLAGGSPIGSSGGENTREDAECLASKTASLLCNVPIGSSSGEGMLNVSSTVSQSGAAGPGDGDGDDVKAKKLRRNRRAKLRAKLRRNPSRSREIHQEVD